LKQHGAISHNEFLPLPADIPFEGVAPDLAGLRRRDSMIAVLIVDLDRFKSVNDPLGHAAGDRLIKLCSRRLEACVRETDTVARLGGDEFAVGLSDLPSPEDAQRIVDAFARELRVPYVLDGRGLRVEASVGVAFYPDDGADRESLMRAADDAMYASKPHRTRDLDRRS
jgi:diguanylate cyclase (GGDEF)-like protein